MHENQMNENKVDNVNHPNHYAGQGEIECIDFIDFMVAPYIGSVAACLKDVIKYTWRCKFKNGREDIEKARWYAAHALDVLELQQKDNYATEIIQYIMNVYTVRDANFLNKALAQVCKNLKFNEQLYFTSIMMSIYGGRLYDDLKTRKVMMEALYKWISEYDGEHPKSDGKQ